MLDIFNKKKESVTCTASAILAGMVLFMLLMFNSKGLTADGVTIAENGQAKAEIVIPTEPSAYVKFAADELKKYLDKITGGNFKITSQPTSRVKIRLGQSPESAAARLKPETLKRDGFFISVKGSDIFIVGVDNPSAERDNFFHLFYDEINRGTILGVYEFLDQLGVRWPAPGPANEYVPRLPDLKIPKGTQKIEPFFSDRMNFSAYNFMSVNPDAREYCASVEDVYLWGVRIKLSGRNSVVGCHSEHPLKLKEAYGDHPERFALIDGKRNFLYSCWTDPAVTEMWKKAADVYFSGGTPAEAGFPNLTPYLTSWPFPFFVKDEFMVDPMDNDSSTDGRCRCARCNAFREKYPCEDDSELLWKVITEVAESVRQKHPGKFITTLVYPPKMKLPKYVKVPENVRVRICIYGPRDIPTPNRLKPDLDLIKIWSNALGGNKPPLWTYQVSSAFGLAGVPETYPHLIAKFLKLCRNDIAGMSFQQMSLTQTYSNLDTYISARMMWNPDRNVDKELTDYFKAYYGPAANPARKLFRRFEDNWVKYWKLATPDKPQSESVGPGNTEKNLQWSKVYSQDEMNKIESMLAAVEKAAAGYPVYNTRAGLLRPWIFDIMKKERANLMGKVDALSASPPP